MFELIKSSKTRIKTALILFLAIVLVGVIDSYFLFWLVFGAVLMVAIKEAKSLFGLKGDSVYVYTSILWIAVYFYPLPEDLFFIVAIGYASAIAHKKNIDKKMFLTLIYPTASFLFLFSLYTEFGAMSLLWLLVVVAGTDTAAYFIGKSYGKIKFCETSPKKTLEGVVGGVIVGSILGVFFANELVSPSSAILVSAIVSISSIYGDLFESYLKRKANVKDSGDILPGHGGILDRMDGYLFAGIVMVVLLRIAV